MISRPEEGTFAGLPYAKQNYTPGTGFAGAMERKKNETLSMGIWAWLAIVEQEADKLSEGGRAALQCLRDDLERLASDG